MEVKLVGECKRCLTRCDINKTLCTYGKEEKEKKIRQRRASQYILNGKLRCCNSGSHFTSKENNNGN